MRLKLAVLLSVAVLTHSVTSERVLGTRKVIPSPAAAAPAQQSSQGSIVGQQKQQQDTKQAQAVSYPQHSHIGLDPSAKHRGSELDPEPAAYKPSKQQDAGAHEDQLDAYYQQQQQQQQEEEEYLKNLDTLSSYQERLNSLQSSYAQAHEEPAAYVPAQEQQQDAVTQPKAEQQQQPQQQPQQQQQAKPQQQQQQQATEAKTESYGDSYQEKDTSCPTPQQADDVKQAYLAHGHFAWRDLARDSTEHKSAYAKVMKSQAGAAATAAAAGAAADESDLQQGKPRAHRMKDTVLKTLLAQQEKLQSKDSTATTGSTDQEGQAVQGVPSQTVQFAKARAAVQTASTSGTSSSTKKPGASVSVAAVDNLQFLMPTSKDETGYGYHGVRAEYLPSDQAIAVGPHPIDPEAVMVIQGAQGSFEVNMVVLEDGQPVPSVTNNRVFMKDMMHCAGIDTTNLYGLNPSAWYDPKEKRYVLLWASAMADASTPKDKADAVPDPKQAFPLFIAVSANRNPLGEWTVWALETVPNVAPGYRFCAGQPLEHYAANTPQGTFTDDTIIVSMGVYCGNFESDEQRTFLSVMYAYSKRALYKKPPPEGCDIYAATYLAPTSWYRSVPPSGQALVEDSFKPFNSYIQPARPQSIEDVSRPPMLVMKVSDTMLSIATLTGESIDKMTSLEHAPKIISTLVGKGGDFSNDGHPEGLPVMPQPGTYKTLDAGDVGTANRTHELRVYWATHHDGLVYLTTSEYWGSGSIRMPSIYWAVVRPNSGLCAVKRQDWGVVASEEGLAVAYPIVATRKDGSVMLAFSYSGAGQISAEKHPAYPGVAYVVVGEDYHDHEGGVIQIVKRGTGVISRGDLGPGPQYWGTYSAGQVWEDKLWFAVVMPEKVGGSYKHGSWVSAVDLDRPYGMRDERY